MNANLFSGRACLLNIDYRSLGQTLCTLQYVNMSLGGRGAEEEEGGEEEEAEHDAELGRFPYLQLEIQNCISLDGLLQFTPAFVDGLVLGV